MFNVAEIGDLFPKSIRSPLSCPPPTPAQSWMIFPRCFDVSCAVRVSPGQWGMSGTKVLLPGVAYEHLCSALSLLSLLTAILKPSWSLGDQGASLRKESGSLSHCLEQSHPRRRNILFDFTWARNKVWVVLRCCDLMVYPFQQLSNTLSTFCHE